MTKEPLNNWDLETLSFSFGKAQGFFEAGLDSSVLPRFKKGEQRSSNGINQRFPKTYTTTQGDCWDTIAYKLWGRENLFHHLMAANPAHRAVRIFSGGVILTVPDITVPAMQWELPPWMQ